jgi:hypothetical protein
VVAESVAKSVDQPRPQFHIVYTPTKPLNFPYESIKASSFFSCVYM